MTGSNVDMVSIPGVVLEVSCRGRDSLCEKHSRKCEVRLFSVS
jgi:hypothetical protein